MDAIADKTALDVYAELGVTLPEEDDKGAGNDLGQDEFLDLLMAQLENQDPLQPTENGDFLGQMALFSTASGIEDLTEAFADLATTLQASQSLQASSLVGHSVVIPTNIARLSEGEAVDGTVDLPGESTQTTVRITAENGELARTIELGPLPEGLARFSWDGLDNSGTFMPDGEYVVEIEAYIDGENTALTPGLAAKVEGVELGKQAGGDVMLNVAGVSDAVSLGSVQSIIS